MAIGRTNSGGGSAGKSAIIVTAPSGSTVTCSNGVDTPKTAQEENGAWTFKGCGAGTWTVTATKDGQTAVREVLIAEESQMFRYYVTITYFAATISITYPAGSVCTCVKGETVLTAPDTSGVWNVTVPEAGDWVVSSTDGESATSKTVTITEDGQSESVTLSYIVYLINGSPIVDDITGGWVAEGKKISSSSTQSAGAPTLTQSDGYITITQSSSTKSGWYRTGNKIDLTNVSSIALNGYLYSGGTAVQCMMACYAEIPTYWQAENSAAHILADTSQIVSTRRLDVSALSGAYYVALCINTEDCTIRADALWLEEQK